MSADHSQRGRVRAGGREVARLSDRHAKILAAMFWATQQSGRTIAYEDIVVEAFRRFPEDFQLRGYPEYPDSSDIHKPLYLALSKAGYVSGAKKKFRLTPLGQQVAEQAARTLSGARGMVDTGRLTRDDQADLARMKSTRAYRMVAEGNSRAVVDSDFYAFFKVSVRTKRHEFAGRLQAVEALLQRGRDAGQPVADVVAASDFLLKRFEDLIREIMGGAE